MPYGFDGWFAGFGLFSLLWFALIVVFWVGIIVLIVLGIRWLTRNSDGRPGASTGVDDDTAMALLRQRFARGEIDATEFEERKRTLGV
ncbi:MAG: SHOCT domain-containing protein [Chloroflexi bacterium]|nr:SHOCT domain-containing protein [Chloroflexota bacterium]